MYLDPCKTYLIDLDGTMYKGDNVIKEAIDFLHHLQNHHISYVFVTNNAMRTPSMIRQKMESMGFKNLRDVDFFTSAMAAASYIQKHSHRRNAFCIGEEGLQTALTNTGFIFDKEEVDFVFVGLDQQADFSLYCKAFKYLQKGALLVGTNADRRVPHKDSYLIGNGAVLEMLKYASEAKHITIGKPSTIMMEETLEYIQKKKEDCIVIGDNLETDIAFAYDNGVSSIMVCTGVHSKEDAFQSSKKPDVVVSSLTELIIK